MSQLLLGCDLGEGGVSVGTKEIVLTVCKHPSPQGAGIILGLVFQSAFGTLLLRTQFERNHILLSTPPPHFLRHQSVVTKVQMHSGIFLPLSLLFIFL